MQLGIIPNNSESWTDIELYTGGNYTNMTTFLQNSSSDHPLECNEGFFYDVNGTGVCRPECGKFGHRSLGAVIIERASVCLGFLVAVAVWILALTIQRSTL